MTSLFALLGPAASRRRPLAVAAAMLLAAPGLHAQYKVIDADGKVTYSDREPSANDGRVSPLGARAAAPATQAELPFELRQVASKYPVTLYTTSGTCEPCAQGRQLLKQRGVPFTEREAANSDDIEALAKISGGREAPTLMIGSQVLRGFAADSWASYLDAAGYPRESHLPPSYQYRPAAPIAARREPAPSAEPAPPAPVPANRPAPTPAGSGGIRF